MICPVLFKNSSFWKNLEKLGFKSFVFEASHAPWFPLKKFSKKFQKKQIQNHRDRYRLSKTGNEDKTGRSSPKKTLIHLSMM